ncbi:hypothetical protein CROQUDRAFT_101497 [Cronartium quercuum f. sp. fusiforme G11]|uniref:Uncharacterized protein n=1 Tax=Cronartium quercuum f. sp. fusiforme G11 TaxID=708437 RepID=A0A9P6T5F3_9BASI|nr:hypothetical protein CROQUDRAFT_101497 [Cronartium quercuum f. sp. fusiforme G11]
MLERTAWYLAVEDLSKEGHGGKDDLSIDSLYYWWENCWKGVRNLPFPGSSSKHNFLELLSGKPKPAEVLECWYTDMWFDRMNAHCAAWLVMKWMKKGAPLWFEALKQKVEPVILPANSAKMDTLAENIKFEIVGEAI